MRARWLILILIVVVAVGLAAWLEPTGVVRGRVRGEPFFDGRPASYWAARLRSADANVQAESRRALKSGGAAAVPVLAAIVAAHDSGWDSADAVRIYAIDALAEIGAAAHDATPALLQALADPDTTVRRHAAEALGAVAGSDPAVVAALTAELKTNPIAAARGLAKCGSAAHPAIPTLIALLQHADEDVRWNAARTLGKIRATSVAPALIAALKDASSEVREHAAEALGDIAADSAVEPLIAALSDSAPPVRRDAARSLGQIGPPAKAALPKLQELAKSDADAGVRDAAAKSIRQIG